MRIANITIYSIKPNCTRPEIPKFFIEEQNRWVDNPNDPDYNDELIFYETVRKPDAAKRFLIDSVDIGDYTISDLVAFRLSIIKNEDETLEYAYKKYILLGNGLEKYIYDNLLTEQRVYKYFEPLQETVTRGGVNLLEHDLKFSISLATTTLPIVIDGLQLVHPLDEMACCKDNNINWLKWLNCEYTLDEMAQTIALWRINKIVESHRSDEQAIYSEKESKKKH